MRARRFTLQPQRYRKDSGTGTCVRWGPHPLSPSPKFREGERRASNANPVLHEARETIAAYFGTHSHILDPSWSRHVVYCARRGGGVCGVSRLGLRDCRGSQPKRCWCGETGKRGDLSHLRAQALVGSSPTTSTPTFLRVLTRRRQNTIFHPCERSPRKRFRYAYRKPVSVMLAGFSHLQRQAPATAPLASPSPRCPSCSRPTDPLRAPRARAAAAGSLRKAARSAARSPPGGPDSSILPVCRVPDP